MSQLWVASCWRNPCQGLPPLRLAPDLNHESYLSLASDLCHLPGLKTLPPEIRKLIWNFLQPKRCTTLRYLSVLELVASLLNKSHRALCLPLSQIRAWRRGQSSSDIIYQEPASKKLFVLLTMDWKGLKQIERSAMTNAEDMVRVRNVAFAVISQTWSQDIRIHFEVLSTLILLNSLLANA